MTTSVRTVVIESPYSGDIRRNSYYARLCTLDSIKRGEAPVTSHLVWTTLTSDLESMVEPDSIQDNSAKSPLTRAEAFERIEAIRDRLRFSVFCVDLGWSGGMTEARNQCERKGLPFEERKLPGFVEAMKAYDEEIARLNEKQETIDWAISVYENTWAMPGDAKVKPPKNTPSSIAWTPKSVDATSEVSETSEAKTKTDEVD